MSNAIQRAIIFGTQKHEGQKRKGTDIPYIVHPMEVMQILTELQCTDETIIAGILHDVLEDTKTNPNEIREMFGVNVLRIVLSVTEDKSKTWQERKQQTIDNLKIDTEDTKLVCFADKLSNIRSMYRDKIEIGEKLFERFNADKNDIKKYYVDLANGLKHLGGRYSSINEDVFMLLYKEFVGYIFNVFQK